MNIYRVSCLLVMSVLLQGCSQPKPYAAQSVATAAQASDIYALGVTWIEMLTGQLPSPHAIGAKAYPSPCENDRVCSLLKRMVAYSPEDRPSLVEIKTVAAEARALAA